MRPSILFLTLSLTLITFNGCVPPSYRPASRLVAGAGNKGLQSGPMIGYVDMFEVMLWVQTKGESVVEFTYWETNKPEVKYTTERVFTEKPSYTAKCVADQVQPGREYQYEVSIGFEKVKLNYPTTFKTQTLWQWRTDPPPFSFVAGSCFFINEAEYDRPKPYGSNYQICSKIVEKKPDFMVWLGDNAYLREPDWYTHTGMVHRYTHTRSLPELQPLLGSTAHYAIWDDHDYGPDNSDASWIKKETAWEVFQDFWGNPTFGLEGQKGCTTMFSYNDADFFLLDNRYFRAPNRCKTCERTSLGKEQLEWLIGALATSRAQFKFIAVGGQVLTTDNHEESAFHDFPAERDELLRRIEQEGIKGVVFLTGDKHFTELSAFQNKAGNWMFDLTSSSLTAGAFVDAATKTQNEYRVPGTVVPENNFCLLKLSGPFRQRTLTISSYNAQGTEMWTKSILPDYSIK
ncbi:MAG: alkaline phosphatase family protein [Saprospiraceae bacterium]|nr:alkaline phosphatase family protein [Saprospiraceae bacterium]